ncbi:hypothetical protein, partial [Bacillus sp. WP8]|uniref:hypothetical protein n=1 Tax=Bacillus sp. WP8 TaxID=756828 RepID=UPI001C9302C1
ITDPVNDGSRMAVNAWFKGKKEMIKWRGFRNVGFKSGGIVGGGMMGRVCVGVGIKVGRGIMGIE